ncbi:hypothetical protein [Anatilimnocola floriformis]|uniref:hypothetical protein n=1 Tax=Anatilimnocola floriformis TaxID=2948575 RepID=UPI0020C397C7|nr:hypothetical protein [Anatilimnocola floriformis]
MSRFSVTSNLLLAIAVSLSLSGCVKAPNWNFAKLPIGDDEPSTAKGAAPFQVKVDGASLAFHAPQVATAKTKTFLPRLEKLLAGGEQAAARQLIYRHPELTLEALRNGLDQRPTTTLKFVAAEYDRWLQLQPADGWSKLYAAGESQPAASYLAARRQLLDKLQSGAPRSEIDAVAAFASGKSPTMIRLDAARTAAIAHLVALQPEQAATILDLACNVAAKCDSYQEFQLRLLQSDALRRANRLDAADQAWTSSITRAAGTRRLQPPLFDPGYWDTASYLRPVKLDWPAESVRNLVPLSPVPVLLINAAGTDGEAIVWGTIGQSLLDRGDHEPALLALKRAETNATNPQVRDWLRLAEANALARVGQSSAATAILASCMANENPALVSAANACLGSIKCHSGDSDSGYRLLNKAMQSQQLNGWIGQADAEADYALACLMRGDEKTGLQCLHSAQERFESQGEMTRLAQALQNEKEYWKVRKQNARVNEIETRIAGIR